MMIAYRLEFELFVAVLMFMVKVGSRRNIKHKLGSPAFVESLRRLMGRLYPDMVWPEGLFHGDTLNYALKGVSPRGIAGLRTLVIRSLLRKRCLESFRLKKACTIRWPSMEPEPWCSAPSTATIV